jgi:hypothetical protein
MDLNLVDASRLDAVEVADGNAVDTGAEPEQELDVESPEPITAAPGETPTEPALAEPSAVAESFASGAEVAPAETGCDECGSLTIESEPVVAETPTVSPANSLWMTLQEVTKIPQFQKLSLEGKHFATAFWLTGDRAEAVKMIYRERGIELPDHAASLIDKQTDRFDRGLLSEVIDLMTGATVRGKFLKTLERALRSRRTTSAQVEALRLYGETLGLLPKDTDAA